MRRYSRRHCHVSPYPVCNRWLPVPLLGILRVGSARGPKVRGSGLIQGAPTWAASFPWRHARLSPAPLGLLECRFQTPEFSGETYLLCGLLQGSFPCRPTPWLRVATSPQVGVSCILLRGVVTGWPSPTARLGPGNQALSWLAEDPLLL